MHIYRPNWARTTSCPPDTEIRSLAPETENASIQSHRLPKILNRYEWAVKKLFSLKHFLKTAVVDVG